MTDIDTLQVTPMEANVPESPEVPSDGMMKKLFMIGKTLVTM